MLIAEKLKIPFPGYQIINSKNHSKIDKEKCIGKYFKPLQTVKLVGNRLVHFKVEKIASVEDYEQKCFNTINNTDVLLQHQVSGVGKSIYLIAKNGIIIHNLQQNRLHEPQGGGGSSYRKTVLTDDTLVNYANKITKYLYWTGPMMIEFKYYRGNYYLMEINGRLWGSLALTVNAGYNYPEALKFVFGLEKELSKNIFHKTRIKRARHLLKDLNWFFTSIGTEEKLINKFYFIISYIKEYKYFLFGKEVFDVESLNDIYPSIRYYILQLKRVVFLLKWKFDLFFIKYTFNKAKHKIALESLIKKTDIKSIVFICRGNINRSVYAHFLASRRYKNIDFFSMGTLNIYNRGCSPRLNQFIKKKFGEDIQHFSKCISKKSIKKYDMVIALDFKEHFRLKRMFPSMKDKIFNLAVIVNKISIDDPYKKNDKIFFQTMKDIESAIDRLI